MMRVKRFLWMLSILALLIPMMLPAGAVRPLDIVTDIRAGAVVNLETGTVVYSFNENLRIAPASITKIMTTLVTLDELDDLSVLTVVQESALQNAMWEWGANLVMEGEVISADSLLKLNMLPSSNAASDVLAELVAGDIDSFVALMNAKAAELGAENTVFANPHGLDAPGHHTTVADLKIIMDYALQNQRFMYYFTMPSAIIPETNLSEERHIFSTNAMIHPTELAFFGPVRGGKTGFTWDAGRCLIAVSEMDGLSYLTIVMGAGAEPIDDMWPHFIETRRLLDAAFASYEIRDLDLGEVELPEIRFARSAGDVSVTIRERLRVFINADIAPEDVTRTVTFRDDLTAPIEQGAEIGMVTFSYGDEVIESVPLLISANIVRNELAYLWHNIYSFVKDHFTVIMIVLLFVFVLLVYVLVARYRRKMIRRSRRMGDVEKRRRRSNS